MTANGSPLLPTSIELADSSALEFVLTDIPLFCQGVMGIGIFTFYFFAKQVKLSSAFLCGTSFLAFISATLDLAQVVIRGKTGLSKEFGLNSVAGFVISREVFLVLSFVSFNIFLWRLVAECPLKEHRTESPSVDATANSTTPPHHSATWGYWGTAGYILRWTSLASALGIGLLQMFWRLIPQQRKLAAVYVAAATLQSTLTAVFFLKVLLNIYASPIRPLYRPLRTNSALLVSLAVGMSISIGNLMLFAFSDTSLGKFLYASQIYILMVHNLHSTFRRALAAKEGYSQTIPPAEEKATFQASPTLPTFDIAAYNRPRAATADSILDLVNNRRASMIWSPPKRSLTISSKISASRNSVPDASHPIPEIRRTSPTTMGNDSDSSSTASSAQPLRIYIPPTAEEPDNMAGEPYRTISLSYYGESPESPFHGANSPALAEATPSKAQSLIHSPSVKARTSLGAVTPSPGPSQPTSMTSLDDLFRHQSELDRSIAALRLHSVSAIVPGSPNLADTISDGDPSRSFSESFLSRTESLSARSEFSLLSVFPEPPQPGIVTSVTKYPSPDGPTVDNDDTAKAVRSPTDDPSTQPAQDGISTTMQTRRSSFETRTSAVADDRAFTSAGTQYDVTSFIGGLTNPPRVHSQLNKTDDAASDTSTTTETATISMVISRPNPTLRTMILSTASLSSTINLTQQRPIAMDVTKQTLNVQPFVASDGGPVLRPLLIGKPISELPQRIPSSSSMVPLAQRRKRGGSLTGQGRPVISAPIPRPSDSTEKPGAFERPRPPPLRLIPE